jgi:hypothetical protein
MSYSFSVSATPKADLDQAIADKGGEAVGYANDEFKDSQRDHIAAIRNAVAQVLPTFGTDDDLVSVSISGHSNPDHRPLEGWSDETMSISLSITPAPVAEA